MIYYAPHDHLVCGVLLTGNETYMELSVVVNQMLVLFGILSVGYIAGKTKLLTREKSAVFAKIIISVAQPCLILFAVMSSSISISIGSVVIFLLIALGLYVLMFAIAFPISRLLCAGKKAPKDDRNLYCYMCMFSNVAFMGFPVCYAIFGPDSGLYVALLSIVFQMLNFSLGVFLISGKSSRFQIKSLINPPFIAAIISIPIAIFGFRAPDIIMDITQMLGNITIPGIMLITGATLSLMPIKNALNEWRVYPVTLIRLLVVPVLTWAILRQFITDDMVLGIIVILSGTPVAMSATMLAIRYGGNEKVASSGLFISTLLSIVTIPLLVYLFI